jgi:ectoine hydroxylase-related dioxygenase (phytanoyl-CoA dioxygenase family)
VPEIVTRDQVEAFRRDGFVCVPSLLSDGEIERFAPQVDEAVARRKRNDPRTLAQKTLYEQSFLQCINLWEDTPALRPLTFHPRIAQAAAELLAVPALRLWHDQALYKEAGGRETDPHQDQPYWPIAETDTITAWIPFDGSTRESGCMGYLPGSHRVGLRKFSNIFFGEDPRKLLGEPLLRGLEPVFVEVPRGAVAFHHGLTVHLAHPNRSGRTRRVHTMIYFRDGSTRGTKLPHFAVDRAGIAVGDAIASAVTPIAWPRPAGDLPEPPPLLERDLANGTLPSRETLG